ncbi:HTH domain-containing protein [Streptococcus suis]
MNRINRVTSILIQLQSKKIIPAKEIAQRFNISLRTVYRDIRTLEEAGIPIGSEAGKGYFLVEGFLLPPVMFTAAEVGTVAELLEEIESENLYQVLVTVDGRTLKIVLLKMQGYSTKEIAPLVHLTTGAIYARLDHLRKKLRKIL